MKITATLNIANQSFSGVKKHVEHDKKINHSNKSIDYEKTQFNQTKEILNSDDLNQIKKERYQDQFEKYNASQKKSRHISKMFKNVNEFVKSKEKTNSFDKTGVATFGNKQNQDELLDGKSPDEVKNILIAESKGMAEYADHFNERHQFIKVARYTTNVDESTPHIHMQMIPLGKTAKGKPSMSLNAALKSEYQYQTGSSITDTRKALSWFREQEDNALVSSVSKELGKDYSLTRTNEHVQDFDAYKKIKERLDDKTEENKRQAKILKFHETEMSKSKDRAIEFVARHQPTHKVPISAKVQEPHEVQTAQGFKEHKMTSASYLFQSAMEIVQKYAKMTVEKIKKWEKSLQDRQKQLDKREQEISQREKNLKQVEKSLNERQTRLNEYEKGIDQYKEKLVGKAVEIGNFEQAKKTNNTSMSSLSKLAKDKLGPLTEIYNEQQRSRESAERYANQLKKREQEREMEEYRRQQERGGR
jgi:acetolactate synthase small subunit